MTEYLKYHIDYICGNVSNLIGILIRARKILPICSLITLYNSLLNPYSLAVFVAGAGGEYHEGTPEFI